MTDESGALWGALFKLIPTAVSALSGLFGNNKRELVDILARDQLIASEMLRRGIDYEDLVARADATNDESGAFLGMLLKAVPAVLGLFGNHKREFDESLFARDFDELMARADATNDESGAFLGLLLRAIPSVLGLFGNHKREFDELLARGDIDEHFVRELVARAEAGDDQSGAFLGMLLKAIPSVLGLFGNHKREFDESLMARDFDELMARADATTDESGAFLGLLLRAVPTVLGLFGNHKRDVPENFIRELVARADAGDDQSGAFLGLLLRAIPSVLGLFGNHKREYNELLARGDLDEHFVRELIARADAGDDQSGAFLGLLLRAIPSVLGLFGNHKREFEDVLYARGLTSLNDLD